MEVGLGPDHILLDGTEPSSLPPKKRGHSPPPILGPWLLWPNGWMDQDATSYDGRSRPGQHCVRCGPSFIPRGAAFQYSAHVCCGQTTGWIKMLFGTKVGLGPGHIVLYGEPAPPKGAQLPNFRPMSIVAKQSPISATAEHLFSNNIVSNTVAVCTCRYNRRYYECMSDWLHSRPNCSSDVVSAMLESIRLSTLPFTSRYDCPLVSNASTLSFVFHLLADYWPCEGKPTPITSHR